MNAKRRQKLETIWAAIDDQREALDAIIAEEQEAFDNLPEALQDGERGQAMSEAIDTLENASSDLSQALEAITEISKGGI